MRDLYFPNAALRAEILRQPFLDISIRVNAPTCSYASLYTNEMEVMSGSQDRARQGRDH